MASLIIKKHLVFIFILSFINISLSLAQDKEELRKKLFNLHYNVALEGYDPVSYFESHEPQIGKSQFSYRYQGVIYHFVNVRHLNKFKANPEKYEPAYGGWCAFALGKTGKKLKANPENFKIYQKRLYVFYNSHGMDGLQLWNKDESNMKERADTFWQKIFTASLR